MLIPTTLVHELGRRSNVRNEPGAMCIEVSKGFAMVVEELA